MLNMHYDNRILFLFHCLHKFLQYNISFRSPNENSNLTTNELVNNFFRLYTRVIPILQPQNRSRNQKPEASLKCSSNITPNLSLKTFHFRDSAATINTVSESIGTNRCRRLCDRSRIGIWDCFGSGK